MIGSISVFMWIASCRHGVLSRARRQARNVSILPGLHRSPSLRSSSPRSFSGSDHAAFLLSLERTTAEDLSGLPAGRSEDLSGAARSEHRKTCVVDAVSGAPIEPLPAPVYARLFPKSTGQRALSAAEADG